MTNRRRGLLLSTFGLSVALALAGCGAGSRTGAQTATTVACSFDKPAQATTVNVLAYNSSAVDPFSNTMVASCSHDNVTVKHDPIDFPGQVQKTTATLSSDNGSYDILETYSYVIPDLASKGKLEPLDDLFAKHADKYTLNDIDPAMVKTMSYDGKLYGLPMQAQIHVMAYRKDLLDKNGIKPPTTFSELKAAAEKIKSAEGMKYPIAFPMLASGDLATAYGAALSSLDKGLVDPSSKRPNFDTPESAKALQALKDLMPMMDPQVTTFDQPKVQQQLYNGTAAFGWMFSGRMNDLTQQKNSKYYDKFGFSAPPAVEAGGTTFGALSVDGWSIPFNTKVDKDLLFQIMAASVSEDASNSAIPDAYPARKGLDQSKSPYAAAADAGIANLRDPDPGPWSPPVTNATLPVIADVITGRISIADGQAKAQAVAEKEMAAYK
ncbi:MAG TPA: extracellular solute-binding protein [Propionibacteriaceae bacterium]|nr:extracellular solute-binding protein [Propionibacteriaceae bacterium]